MSLQDGLFIGTRTGHNRRTGRFVRGNEVYQTRQKLLKQALAALHGAYVLNTPADQLIAALAATHIVAAGKARSTVRRVAESRCADRLLSRLTPRPAPARTLDDILAGEV
jgi:hypothetical protein